jgi:hypothetical protein
MTERGYKKLIILRKVCGQEFELKTSIEIYAAEVEAAEVDPVEFAGTSPSCRKDDPFLRLMDGIPGIFTSGDFARSKQ